MCKVNEQLKVFGEAKTTGRRVLRWHFTRAVHHHRAGTRNWLHLLDESDNEGVLAVLQALGMATTVESPVPSSVSSEPETSQETTTEEI